MKKQHLLLKYAVGIDVSKVDFKACIVKINQQQEVKVVASRAFENTKYGFESLLKWTIKNRKENKIPIVFNVEATGVYYENLAFFLSKKKQTLSVVLANRAKKYIESLGIKTKNDKVDAKGLAHMAAEQSLKSWQPANIYYYQLRALTRYYQSLQESKTQIICNSEAVQFSSNKSNFVFKGLEKQRKLLENEILRTRKQIEKLIRSNPEVSEKVDKICQIKGLAILSLATVIAETFGFDLFENQNQLVSYAGYDIVENQSGKRTGKTKISKKGNSRIRRILHFPAFKAVCEEQPIFYNLFHRTYKKHSIKMKSYVAVQKKLLTTIFALWKKNEAYENQYSSQNNIQRKRIGVSLSGSIPKIID